jgi:hypothetical protein
MVIGEKHYCQRHFLETDQATTTTLWRNEISRMVLVRARDNFEKKDVRMSSQRMHLNSMLAVSKNNEIILGNGDITIDSLKAATGWYIDIVAIWAKQLHCVQSRQIRTSAGYNIAAYAVYSWTDPE